jgi:hypothetical protein
MDLVVTLTVILSFATLLTAHLTLVAGLVARRPRWRGAIALVVVPLAPYWGFREQMKARAVVWAAALLIYGIALIVAQATVR